MVLAYDMKGQTRSIPSTFIPNQQCLKTTYGNPTSPKSPAPTPYSRFGFRVGSGVSPFMGHEVDDQGGYCYKWAASLV